tara:strand:+ start:22035 stop:29342 length:7308 start_codon:yes stop_codon:yes gene_type:complete
VNNNAKGKYTFWVAHYFDDFMASYCVPDDLNSPTSTSITHAASHHGNPLNGEAPLNTRYRYSYIERAQLTGKYTTTVEKKDGVVGTSSGTTIADKPLWHNNGIHEWLTHDPMRLGDDSYIGRANPRYPDTIAHANRFRYDSSTTYGNGVTAENDGENGGAYLWFSNGYAYVPNIMTNLVEIGNNQGTYTVPTCDWDPTYGRKNITEMHKKTGGGHSTGYFDGSEGRPQHAPSLGSDESLMCQQASLVGVLAGELIPRTRSHSYKDSGDSNLGGKGTLALYDPLKSPTGKPFLCIQTYRPFNTYRPVIFYENSIGEKMDGDIFHMRISLDGLDVSNSGDSAALNGQDGTYRLTIGYPLAEGAVFTSQDGWAMSPDADPSDGPMVTLEFTISSLQSSYPYVASTSSSDSSYTLDERWSDIEIALDFTNQKWYYYRDGTKISGPTDMGVFMGQGYQPGMIAGWQLDMKNSADQADSMFFTCIDRVACYHPLNDSVASSGAGDATKQEVDVLDMSMDKSVNGTSSMQITVADDSKIRNSLLTYLHSAGTSELVMWLNTTSIGRYNMLWRGFISNAQIKQSVDERTTEITLTAEDVLSDLDRQLASWDIGADSVSRNEILKSRTSEINNLRSSMYFGARKLQSYNQTIGLGKEQAYSTTTDQRMQLGSAHPIQIYNNEDTNGPNDAEDTWAGYSSGITGVGTEIQNRSIHAEWVRDLCKSKWFTKKFGKIGNHRLALTGVSNFELQEIKWGSGTSITPSNTSCTFLGRTAAGASNRPVNAGVLQIINDRGGGNDGGVVVMDVYKSTHSSTWSNADMRNETYRSAPHESIHITSATAANATTGTINKVEHDAAERCAVFTTSSAHNLGDGDTIMIYGLSGTNVQNERTMSYSTTAKAASNDNGYGISIQNENFYFVKVIDTTTFKLLPSSYTDVDGRVYKIQNWGNTQTADGTPIKGAHHWKNKNYAWQWFRPQGGQYMVLSTNSLGPGGSEIDFIASPYWYIDYATPTSGTSPSGNLSVDHTVDFTFVKITDWNATHQRHDVTTYDITVNYTAGQVGRTYPEGSIARVRYYDNDYKHCWALFADMRNDGNADADGGTRKNTWGGLYPANENYSISLVYADHFVGENAEPRPKFCDLKVGEEVHLWEIDAAREPFTGNSFASLGSADSWEDKAGALLLIDTSPFFNLNTESNFGHAGAISGGNRDLGDYSVDVEGIPIIMDNYWRQAPSSFLNSESPISEHPNAYRFTSVVTTLETTTEDVGSGSQQYIKKWDGEIWLRNAYHWPTSSFIAGATGSDQLRFIGMIRAIEGSGAEATESIYYYTWTHKEQSTLGSDYTAGGTTFALADASRFDDTGTGSVNGLYFQWTSKSGNNLQGCTGPALSIDHSTGTIVSDNKLKGVWVDHIPNSEIDETRRYDSIRQAVWLRLEMQQVLATAGQMYHTTQVTSSSTTMVLSHNNAYTFMNYGRHTGTMSGAGVVTTDNRGYGIIDGDSFEWTGFTATNTLTGVALLSKTTAAGNATDSAIWPMIWKTGVGSKHDIMVKSTGSSGGTNSSSNNLFDSIEVYNGVQATLPMKLMMEVDGYVKAPNKGTFYQHDKIRFLQMNGLANTWLSQAGLKAVSDINNVPRTNNMTQTQQSYSAASDFDDYGSILEGAGKTTGAIISEMTQNAGVGENETTLFPTTFSYLVGRHGRIEFRPMYNNGIVFNANNLKLSNINYDFKGAAAQVRVYYNDGTSFVDYPENITHGSEHRWKIVDYPSIKSQKEAKAVASNEYHKSRSAPVSVDAEILRYKDTHTLDRRNELMLEGGRYGYVADVACRQFGANMEEWTSVEGGCIFTGPQNALDGSLYESIQDVGQGDHETAYATGRYYAPQQFFTWWGAKSVSYAMQIVHLPKDMPLVSETTGEELRIHIAITGSGSATNPEFRVEFVDYTFDDTKSNGNPAGSMWSSAKPKIASQSHATNTESYVNCRGNGFYEVGIPTTYWSSAGSKKMIISVNYDYLYDIMLYRNGANGRTAGNITDRRRNAHASATVTGTYNTASLFPLGLRRYDYGAWADTRAEWYAPRLHVCEDVNFQPGTYVTYTDDALNMTNETLVIQRINWTINKDGRDNVRFKLGEDMSRVAQSIRASIFPNKARTTGPRSGQAGVAGKPVDEGDPGYKGAGSRAPKGTYGSDAPNTKTGEEQSGDNRPTGLSSGIDTGKNTNSTIFMGDGIGSMTSKSINTNMLTTASFKKQKGAMDLGGAFSNDFSILGQNKPTQHPTSIHAIDGTDMVISPSIGSTVMTEEGIVFPGNIGGSGEDVVTHEHSMLVRIPNDAINGGFGVYATYSTGGTSDETAVIETTIKCVDTGATETGTAFLRGASDNKGVTLVAPSKIDFSSGNRLQVTMKRVAGTGDDTLYFSSVRLHTTEVQYKRKSVPDDESQASNLKPYSGSSSSITDISDL